MWVRKFAGEKSIGKNGETFSKVLFPPLSTLFQPPSA
jgi:hypothetical protein